jgi:predicted Zn-dependent protease
MTRGAALLVALHIVSVSDEIAVGRQTQVEVRRQTPRLADVTVNGYVARIGHQLASHAPGVRYPYNFSVANYREINAFALPGGPVWVNRGAIASAGNESQFAAVLAHEIAHVALRHSARQLSNMMVTNLGLNLLGALLGNSGGANAAGVAARFVASGTFLKFSRDDEREADRVGAAILAHAGWDPRGMIDVMRTIRAQERRDPTSVDVFFSNHPSSQERIAQLRQTLPRNRSGRRDTTEFQSIRARLRTTLPPPRSMTANGS